MNRTGFRILLFAAAAIFFGWETYRAWVGPVLPGSEAPAEKSFSLPSPRDIPEALGNAQHVGLSSVVNRPVFRPDRRPFPGAGAVPQRNYDAELARYTVLGVLMEGDDRKAVVVSSAPGNTGRWEVGAGDSLPGFTVKEVGPDGVVLTADNREFTLPLYAGGPKAAGGGPLRTEVGPAPSPAASPPVQGARPVPSPGRFQPPARTESPESAKPFRVQTPQPSEAPGATPRTYPRYYVPGRR